MAKVANRQLLAFSERGQFSRRPFRSSTWNECYTEWTRITRFESQQNERRVHEDQFLCFGKRYDNQRTLVIRIAVITLASDSAITIARFCPSKFRSQFILDSSRTLPPKKLRVLPLPKRRNSITHTWAAPRDWGEDDIHLRSQPTHSQSGGGRNCRFWGTPIWPKFCNTQRFALKAGRFQQGVSKQGVTTFAWRPGWQYDVAANASTEKCKCKNC